MVNQVVILLICRFFFILWMPSWQSGIIPSIHRYIVPVTISFNVHMQLGMKLVRIVSVRPDHFSDSDSFGQNYPEILGFGNKFGFFFSETKTNTVRVLSVGIGKRSETIRNVFRISADTYICITFSYGIRWRQTLYQNCRGRWDLQLSYWLFYYLRLFKGLNIHYNIPY